MSARVVRLILSNDVLIGDGDKTPLRKAYSFHTLDGEPIAQMDSFPTDADGRTTWHRDTALARLMTEGE